MAKNKPEITEEMRQATNADVMKRYKEFEGLQTVADNYRRTVGDTNSTAAVAALSAVPNDKNGLIDYSKLKDRATRTMAGKAADQVYHDRTLAIDGKGYLSKNPVIQDAIRSGVVGPTSVEVTGLVDRLGDDLGVDVFNRSVAGSQQRLDTILKTSPQRAWTGFDAEEASRILGTNFKDIEDAQRYAQARNIVANYQKGK